VSKASSKRWVNSVEGTGSRYWPSCSGVHSCLTAISGPFLTCYSRVA